MTGSRTGRCLALLGLGAVGLPGSTAGQVVIEVEADRFVEERVDRSDVSSASMILGVMSGDPTAPVRPGLLHVRVPEATEGLLCVEIRSADGEYRGRVAQPLEGVEGDVALRYPVREGRYLRGAASEELALLAFVLPDPDDPSPDRCDIPSTDYLIASWTRVGEEAEPFLLINAERAVAEVRARGRDAPPVVRCRAARALELRVVYGQRCDLEGWESSVQGRLTLRRGMDRNPPLDFRILR